MGFIGDILNPNAGAGWTAQGTPIMKPGITEDNLTTLYNATRGGIDQQQNFVNALNAQNGLANQQNVFGQQQALADQLGAQARGEGPNPAQAALNQATGNNVAQQAALMGSARGAGANAGLIARQAAQQGAGIQQQAAGQSAIMQAQQQIAAQQALAQQQAQMAGMANQQVNQQAGGLNALNQFTQGAQANALNGVGAYNNAAVASQSNMNNNNQGIAKGNQGAQLGMLSGIGNAAGAAFGMAKGGVVPGYADGGAVVAAPLSAAPGGPRSYVSSPSVNPFGTPQAGDGSYAVADPGMAQATSKLAGGLGKGLSSLFSSGGAGTAGGGAATLGGGGGGAMSMMSAGLSQGGKVKGQPKVSGDSQSNDTVPTMLSPGEIVLPRSVTKATDAPNKAKAFVEAVLAHGMKKK